MKRYALPGTFAVMAFAGVLLLWPKPEPVEAATVVSRPPNELDSPVPSDEPPSPEPEAPAEPPGTASIEGTLVDERGARAANVTISARARGASFSTAKLVRTDWLGHFLLDGLHEGTWEVVAGLRPRRAVGATVSVQAGTMTRLDLTQPPLGAIVGTVTEAAGRSLEKELVVAVCGRVEAEARTDATGRFRIDTVALGASCRVMLAADRWKAESGMPTTVTSPPSELKLVTGRIAVIRGRAVDESGAPVEKLRFGRARGPRFEGSTFELDARSRPAWVTAEGRALVPIPEVPIEGPDVDLGTVVLRPARSVAIRVKDGLGTPIAAPCISSRFTPWCASRDRRGNLDLRLPYEDVEVTASHDGATARVMLAADATELEITLNEPRREVLRGHVVWPRGRLEVPLLATTGRESVEVDANDDFVFHGLAQGPVTVWATLNGRGKVRVPQVSVTIDATAAAYVELRAMPLSGRAVLLFARPLPERPLVMLEVDGEKLTAEASWNPMLTECRLTSLPLGKIDVLISGRPPITLDVTEGAPVQLTVTD